MVLMTLNIIPSISHENITFLSVFTIIILIYRLIIVENKNGLSAVLFGYLILTQFGMSTIYYLLGSESISSFSSTTLRFLSSNMYPKAIGIGLIALIACFYGLRVAPLFRTKATNEIINENQLEKELVYYTGILFLAFVLVYLLLFILSGRISIGMSYYAFLDSGIVNGFYSWILMLYSLGICFIVAVENNSRLKVGVVLFSLSALVFFSTGNRGEVLYATLAAIGIVYYRNNKIKFKQILLIVGLVLIVIPFIRSTRHAGTINSFDYLKINSFDAIAEMGHQLRLSVLILEEFNSGFRNYIYGFSYINPVVNFIDNFIPFSIRLNSPLDFNFETAFPGLGFSQVAESYANFGVFGVFLYHFIVSFWLRRGELNQLKGLNLAFYGGFLTILINATRNRFAFVFGQLVILTLIRYVLKIASNHKKLSNKEDILAK